MGVGSRFDDLGWSRAQKCIQVLHSLAGSFKRRVMALACIVAVLFTPISKAAAATIKGYDLYGRMPYDEWLFATSRLVDPNLLKRSYPEIIVQELPYVLSNFKKRKALNELIVVAKGFGYFAIGVFVMGVLYKNAVETVRRQGKDGGSFSPSAISKKGPRKGRQIEGMEEGWLDMDLTADDDEPPSPPPPKKKK